MTQGAPHTGFNTSRLLRTLAAMVAEPLAESKQPFAERLGQWLDFADALSLYAALNTPMRADNTVARSGPAASAREDLVRVREALSESITTDGILKPGKARVELPTPAPKASVEDAADFAPYHRYYAAHQRDMNAVIGPLRARVRAILSQCCPRLAQLAELDALMDQALAARERSLLATVPTLLGKRFETLFAAHQAAMPDAPAADDPQRWMQRGGWLAVFCKDMQAVLLAELALRLQPVAGLIAALDNEVTTQQ